LPRAIVSRRELPGPFWCRNCACTAEWDALDEGALEPSFAPPPWSSLRIGRLHSCARRQRSWQR
jgi:hypothetical protein